MRGLIIPGAIGQIVVGKTVAAILIVLAPRGGVKQTLVDAAALA